MASEPFALSTPVLVVRWRLSDGTVTMLSRHMRALGHRRLEGRPFSPEFLAWVKQHLEWTLAEGSRENPDGVLMLVVDEDGRAAMSVGPYRPLEDTGPKAVADRARQSLREAERTGVAPETLWVVDNGTLVAAVNPGQAMSGASTLVRDLAEAMGIPTSREENLLQALAAGAVPYDELFLASDEHGIVPVGEGGPVSERFRDAYARLRAKGRIH